MALNIKKIQEELREFAKIREWDQFHNPKNLTMALSVEASELLEVFQWLSPEESENLNDEKRENVSHELADILLYALRLADKLEIDLERALEKKMAINAEKYPANLVVGSAKKYTEY